MTSNIPFSGSNSVQILRQIISEPTPELKNTLPDIDPRVNDLVKRLMSKTPTTAQQRHNGDRRG